MVLSVSSAGPVGDGLREARERLADGSVGKGCESVDGLARPRVGEVEGRLRSPRARAARRARRRGATGRRRRRCARRRRRCARAGRRMPRPSRCPSTRYGIVGTPARRSVPGTLPVSSGSADRSMTSSSSWKATPAFSPKSNIGSSYSRGPLPKMTPACAGSGDERAGLVGEHLQVELDRVIAVLRVRPSRASDRARAARTCRPAAGSRGRRGAP